MKKLIILLVFGLTVNSIIFSQSFKTFISDTANYYYRIASTVYEENNTYGFFLIKTPRDSGESGNINYIKLDEDGNIIKDTILLPNSKIYFAKFLKTANYYYILTFMLYDKTNSLNGRIFKLDSAFNIITQKNLPYFGDSTFYAFDIVEVENNNILFNFVQFSNNSKDSSFVFKTNKYLDSLNFNRFAFVSNTITYNPDNQQYIAAPFLGIDTIFAYLSYDLNLDSIQLAPNNLPQIVGRVQQNLLLLNNSKKIYSSTAIDGSGYYMGIYLFDKEMQVLNYHLIDNVNSFPGVIQNLSFISNTEDIYFVGSTNYWAYPEDSNSIILSRLDTNLNIDYVRYFHNERALTPDLITTTSDNGCIVAGRYAYMTPNYVQCTFIIKFDSLGNLLWQHGVELQEQLALVYPNPAQNTLYVKTGLVKQEANFAIFDMQGRQIFTKPLQPQENSFNISTLSTGVYIYRITDKEKTLQTGKIVKE